MIGLSIEEYNEITPSELNLHIECHNERDRRRNNFEMTAAYLTAAWSRSKRMPELKKVLQPEPKREQAPEDMLNIVKKLNAALGGTSG